MEKKSFTIKKVALSLGLIIVSAVYAVWQNLGGDHPATAPAPLPTPQPMMGGPGSMMRGQYIDGSYTGSAIDAYYGMVQVKAVVKNGRLADVQFLQYPNDQSTSREINGQAMPLLTQEAIQAQSAQVDGVSGATETSGAFKQSLASALAIAK